MSSQHDQDVEFALHHLWDWFALHAAQRMQVVSFFFAAIGFSVAGYGTALASGYRGAAAGIAVLDAVLAFAFWRLDRRTVELVKAAEAPLAAMQGRLATRLDTPGLRLVDQVNTKGRLHSYTDLVRFLSVTTVVASVAAAVYAAAAGR